MTSSFPTNAFLSTSSTSPFRRGPMARSVVSTSLFPLESFGKVPAQLRVEPEGGTDRFFDHVVPEPGWVAAGEDSIHVKLPQASVASAAPES